MSAADPPIVEPKLLSLAVSIVLYKTPLTKILPLVQQILDQGASRLYLIDNSPPSHATFAGWSPPDRVVTIETRMNLGYGRANNLAIRDAVMHWRYHLICNPDILLSPNALPALVKLMDERAEVGLCMPRVTGMDGRLHYLCKRAPSPLDLAIRRFCPASWFQRRRRLFEMRDHSYDDEMNPPFLSGCFMFFRSRVLAALDGFDERFFLYLEDLDLSRRSQRIAPNLYYPHVQIMHEYQGGAHKSLRLLFAFCVSVIRYYRKWGWFEQPWRSTPNLSVDQSHRSKTP